MKVHNRNVAVFPAPATTRPSSPEVRIGPWRLDPHRGVLTDGPRQRRLNPRTLAVLGELVKAGGAGVHRVRLIDLLWQGNWLVGCRRLTDEIHLLRSALGDDPRNPQFIRTLPRQGYRLVAPVRGWWPSAEGTPATAGMATARLGQLAEALEHLPPERWSRLLDLLRGTV